MAAVGLMLQRKARQSNALTAIVPSPILISYVENVIFVVPKAVVKTARHDAEFAPANCAVAADGVLWANQVLLLYARSA